MIPKRKNRLFYDPILFTVSSPTLEENIDLIHQILTCSRSVFVDYISWSSFGAPIVNMLLDVENFDNLVIDIRFIGNNTEFSKLIQAVYNNWSQVGLTLSAYHVAPYIQRIYESNLAYSNKLKRPPNWLLVDFSYITDEHVIRSLIPKLERWCHGFVVQEDFCESFKDCNTHVIIRSKYAMDDVLSIDMSEKSRLVKLLNDYDHLLYDTSQILRESITAFDILRKFLEVHKLL